jgi:CheY-like chemotaxis protein
MFDVLFVDDELSYAKSWAERITDTMQLTTYATDNPQEALNLVHDQGIRVAVIDQVLQGSDIDGVRLGIAIRKADSRIWCILLSGEATPKQITDAYDHGIQRHIHKNDAMAELPNAIRQYVLQYRESFVASLGTAGTPLFVQRTKLLRRQTVSYYLSSIDSVDRDCVFEDEWRSYTQINAGEEIEETVEITWSRSDNLEVSSETRIGSEGRLGTANVPILSAALRTEVATKAQLSTILTSERRHEVKRTLKLPPEPVDPKVPHIISRLLQVAPVYIHVTVTLASKCSCCENVEPIKGHIYLPRNRYATRQVDYDNNGKEDKKPTGFKDLTDKP